MEKLTLEELMVISDCILFRINEMYRNQGAFSCYLETSDSIRDGVKKLRKLNDKVFSMMKQEEKKKLSKLDLLRRNNRK